MDDSDKQQTSKRKRSKSNEEQPKKHSSKINSLHKDDLESTVQNDENLESTLKIDEVESPENDVSMYRVDTKIKTVSDVNEDKLNELILKYECELEKIYLDNQHLKDLEIIIPFEVPRTHRIEGCVGSKPTKEENMIFKRFEMKLGNFTKAEDNCIKANFKEFCELHGLNYDAKPFLNFVFCGRSLLNVSKRIKFVRFLGKGLENRTLYQIYQRFQKLFSTVIKGKFTPMEDCILLSYMNKHKNEKQKHAKVAKILNRSPMQILKRFSTLTQLEQFSKIPSQTKSNYLISSIMEVLNVSTIEELKEMKITDDHWKEISEKMDDTPVHQLKTYWRLSVKTRLFNHNIKINKVLRKIINDLNEREITDWKTIDWNEVVTPFKSKYYTTAFVYGKFKDVKRRFVPIEHRKNPNVCIRMMKNLYDEYPSLLKKVKPLEYNETDSD